ncbi:MAG TPA: aldose epimerase family protein [Candidatus Binatia bacterium]|jgi:aldose 1-epimerase|nr:aldose epimerase family protein [Candidatus Binatia bacterium]
MKSNTQKSSFGTLPDGTAVDVFTLTNSSGLVAKLTNYGTIITELHVPDRHGKLGDVVLGFDNLGQYLKGHPYFGCTVGRVANRIAKGKFSLEGKTYTLAVNNGLNHLHGGLKGFDKVVWKAEPQAGASVKFSYTSADGEEGYPGSLQAIVVMALTEANELRIDYTAASDKPTPINLTNHSYFNLAGQGEVLGHALMVAADHFTPTDATLVPTGEIKSVKGTPLDFTTPKTLGSRISELSNDERGYDHNFVLNNGGKTLALAARVFEPESGRVMEVHTTEPGVQLYTANYLDGSLTGKGGIVYRKHTAFCLETQHYPDSVNKPNFPSTILRPGQTYRQTTVHKFAVQ